MRSGFILPNNQGPDSQNMRDLLGVMRRTRATQQWLRYVSHWPIALNALRQLWEMGRVSEMKSPFWEPSQKTANQ